MIGMRESHFRSVGPLDRLRSPVVLVVINISPFGLRTTSVFLNSRCHVDSILLFQLFISQVLWWGWLDSYVQKQRGQLCDSKFTLA
jgi:hypothetical protein